MCNNPEHNLVRVGGEYLVDISRASCGWCGSFGGATPVDGVCLSHEDGKAIFSVDMVCPGCKKHISRVFSLCDGGHAVETSIAVENWPVRQPAERN